MSIAIVSVYFGTLGLLALVGAHRTWAVLAVRRYVERVASGQPPAWPSVLVQVPLYDEALVAERIIHAAARLRYPRDRLHIQVLDDSTDRTRIIVDAAARQLAEAGTRITVVRRTRRDGYKAGALAHGLVADGQAEIVAIFDADFVPPADFLVQTVPVLMDDPELGLVQARWGHLNRDQSLLTRAQAIFLDGHFAVEHAARDATGHPFNFNGTAGIWRRRALEDAGGWQSDTITEDLDISYRAQLQGWRFAYAHRVIAPAELPERFGAFRAQQARWVRGSVQTARKLLLPVLRSERLSMPARVDAVVHLTNNLAYLAMAALAIMLPLALVLREELGWMVPGGRSLLSGLDLSMLGVGTSAMVVFYAAAIRRTGGRLCRRIPDLLFALCLGAGMSLSNALEVLRGLRRRPSEFVRTPKRGGSLSCGGPLSATRTPGEGRTAAEAANEYRARAPGGLVAAELSLAAYYAAATAYALRWGVWGALPFLLLYLVGFAAVGGGSAQEAVSVWWRRRRRRAGGTTEAVELSAFETRRG